MSGSLYKNGSGQIVAVVAYDTVNDTFKTGDAANITAYVSKDGGAPSAIVDSASELDATNMAGMYVFALTKLDTDANNIIISSKSTTTGVSLSPLVIYTTAFPAAVTHLVNTRIIWIS